MVVPRCAAQTGWRGLAEIGRMPSCRACQCLSLDQVFGKMVLGGSDARTAGQDPPAAFGEATQTVATQVGQSGHCLPWDAAATSVRRDTEHVGDCYVAGDEPLDLMVVEQGQGRWKPRREHIAAG